VEAPATKVLELVVFKLNEGISREQFLATNAAVSTWIGKQPGFVSHELAYDGEGDRWIEVAWWETMEEAHAAAERAMTSESCAPMFALIDMDSTLMLHGESAITPVYAGATPGGA
jgi:antibiotic biosynthesis monooxygenase (ABM) superfamily enzyme